MNALMSDGEVIERIFDHIDNKTTDLGEEIWREPADNYRSEDRFKAEIALMRRLPIPFCPSAALPEPGSFVARTAALTPILTVRGEDGIVRAFRNACRHRGMAVAEGSGCAKIFICPYHAWTYKLDGSLNHIAGAHGFPDVDPETHGLVPVKAEEKNGLVLVTQDDPIGDGCAHHLPEVITPDQVVFDKTEFTDEANWKLIGETSMEGYHIKGLHTKTFYPYGMDNLNVVETAGLNSRITFPFRRIEKLRDIPPMERRIKGMVTYVYQMFPNTHVSVLSNHSMLIILEPVTPTRTRWEIYRLRDADAVDQGDSKAKRDADFVKETGLREDRDAACSIQAGLESGANSHFTFGRFEKAIVHFHKNLTAMVGQISNEG